MIREILVLVQVLKEIFQYFTVRYDICCRLLVGLYWNNALFFINKFFSNRKFKLVTP